MKPSSDQPTELRDAIPSGPARGRGAQLNPGNRFEDVRLHVLGEHLDEVRLEHPAGRQVPTRVYADKSRSLINRVDSPDLPFNWTINPYRGCEHGCIYCYARPGHEYLGMSCGLDFETRIMAKLDAPEILRDELSKPSWQGEPIAVSGVTDCYQPIEAELRITRRILEVCVEFAQPVSLVTKNRLITRDLDLLKQLNAVDAVSTAVSITTLDNRLASAMEPRASSPRERLGAIRQLADEGIPVCVMVAPIIPGLNESEAPAILKAAAEAGAVGAGYVMLRLPHQIKALFLDWLAREFPDRAGKVESQLRGMRHGDLYASEFFERQRGVGARAEQLASMFRLFERRFGLTGRWSRLSNKEFLRRKRLRGPAGQLSLWADRA
ncbi:MAG: PA0069 family radical SAM protein [Phycisphaerales bacterium]